MKQVTMLYISFVMLILLSASYIFAERWRYWKNTDVYEGFITVGFEHEQFVGCTDLGIKPKDGYTEFRSGFLFDKELNFWKTYSSYFVKEMTPVYVKFRAEMTPIGNGWMGYSHSLRIHEVLAIDTYDARPCEPKIPGLGLITVHYNEPTTQEKLKKIRIQSFNKFIQSTEEDKAE